MMTSHATLYGGLIAARLDGVNLVLTFDDEAQRQFDWPHELTLHLDITDDERSTLRTSLPEVLAVGPNAKVPTISI